MTYTEKSLASGRPVHPSSYAKPSNRTYMMIPQINALRREGYTLKEIANFYNSDEGTMSLRSYGLANDNAVTQKQGTNMYYRRMHIGACCHLDYVFLGLDDSDGGFYGHLKFGSKFRKEIKENNDKTVRREFRIRTKQQRQFVILGDKLNAKKG